MRNFHTRKGVRPLFLPSSAKSGKPKISRQDAKAAKKTPYENKFNDKQLLIRAKTSHICIHSV